MHMVGWPFFYRAAECQVFEQLIERPLSLVLFGPPSCGKTRVVEYVLQKRQPPGFLFHVDMRGVPTPSLEETEADFAYEFSRSIARFRTLCPSTELFPPEHAVTGVPDLSDYLETLMKDTRPTSAKLTDLAIAAPHSKP